MNNIKWGIIGCGDVIEVKSGPAFNKVANSELVAVMRRDGAKAKDYASRHGVDKWYDNADDLINDPAVNAIYVATPPSSHEEYTIKALAAAKPVYVEKPMSINAASSAKMVQAANEHKQKLVVAHYRRAQPLFQRIKQLVDGKIVGDIQFATLEIFKKGLSEQDLENPQKAWRVNPSLSGGGLFHDLAPHQLDIMYYLFGGVSSASGMCIRSKNYHAPDIVSGHISFNSGILFNGTWAFNVHRSQETDQCLIMGSNGSIRFSFFDQNPLTVTVDDMTEQITFDVLPHVQQPMIEKVVNYFLGNAPNPCSGEDGIEVMKLIDTITAS